MIKTVYIDTSVVGGYFDEELKYAPEKIRTLLDQIPVHHKGYIEIDEQADRLANLYINNRIVGIKSLADCRHIATATVNNIEILTSWNFKRIVNLDKIHLYNGINLQNGYRTIEIRMPREIVNYEG